MGRLGMTVPTIQQRFPRPPTGFVLGAQVRRLGSGHIQSQFGAHRRKTFASFQTLQETFQALGFFTHGKRMAHKLSPRAQSRDSAYHDLA